MNTRRIAGQRAMTSVTLIYTASMDRSSDLSGIAAMLAATAFFVVGDSFMKLVTEDLPPFEVLFLRSIAASLACAVIVALRGDRRGLSGVLNSPCASDNAISLRPRRWSS